MASSRIDVAGWLEFLFLLQVLLEGVLREVDPFVVIDVRGNDISGAVDRRPRIILLPFRYAAVS